jgi:hypothetical protein
LLDGAAVVNNVVWNATCDNLLVYNGGQLPNASGSGLIFKSGGTGTTTIGNNLGFDNGGAIDERSGTLALPANLTHNATLRGMGTCSVSGTLSNAGTVAPGASPGTLGRVGRFAQAAGGTFAVDLLSLASHELFNVSGTASRGETPASKCFDACSFLGGVTLSGFTSGAFERIHDVINDRALLRVTEALTAVPEPATYALLLGGLGLVGWLARRRHHAA